MSNNKQSSVEWLKDQLEHFGNKHELQVSWATVDELAEQAKAMHKEEIMEAIMFGDCRGKIYTYSTLEEYYNETYGGNNEQQ